MTEVNGFKGFVGYGIRELNINETNIYCLNNISPTRIPMIENQVNFTNDFLIRTYTSGCYYYSLATGKWLVDGMSLFQEDTNIYQTHCSSYHLTSFAGGLDVMPNRINLQYNFANYCFNRNYAIYFTIIVFVFLYIFFGIFAIFMDKRDRNKLKIIPLKDNCASDTYFYEMMVYTGNHKEAGTNSNVIFFFSIKIFVYV
jgi:hypothetical protein